MKFLCVPCDSPMKLQTVGPPERGSLSIVYACPECGYEMAMLTNAYETQIVQSLGVRVGPAMDGGGPAIGSAAPAMGPEMMGAEIAQSATSTSGSGCPFAAMVPTTESVPAGEAYRVPAGEAYPVRWTAAAEARLANIPAFVRPMARTGIERFARERGAQEVDEQILDAARDFFGM
jgi:hypothetical protein